MAAIAQHGMLSTKMADIKALFTASLLGMILIIGGSSYLLQETGSKRSCSTGWQLNDNGSYSCGSRILYCSKVWDSSNTKNYWCQEATPILQEQPQETQAATSISSNKYLCNQKECVPI